MEIERVQNPVVSYARQYWGLFVTKGGGTSGMPDYIFWIPGGKPLLIEFKDGDKGVLSDIQAHIINQFKGWGYNVEVCISSYEGKRAVARAMGAS